MSSRPQAGDPLSPITVSLLGGGDVTLGAAKTPGHWQMVVVYRGKHCPICTRYLGELNGIAPKLRDLDVEIVALSADPEEKAAEHMETVGPDYPVGYGLAVEDMKRLGLYVSDPRSPKETDRPFAEPGLFVINGEGRLQIVDISNAPFARPALESLAKGIGFVKDNDYPIRGTHG